MNINIHKPGTIKRNLSKNQNNIHDFGFFLAGIIDGDGHFSAIPQLVICFHEKDIGVAYFLKSQIKYGVVSKVKNKKAIKYVVSHPLGLQKICRLIHNKLQHHKKIEQYNTRLAKLAASNLIGEQVRFTEKKSFVLNENSWFAGFFLSDGSFQIKILHRKNKELPEIRLVIQIDQKKEDLLLQIKTEFGGSIGFRSSQDTYYYSSVSFESAKKIIRYFDKYHLMGVKLTQYTLWRKVYLKIQEKKHLTPMGVQWIENVKKRMSNVVK